MTTAGRVLHPERRLAAPEPIDHGRATGGRRARVAVGAVLAAIVVGTSIAVAPLVGFGVVVGLAVAGALLITGTARPVFIVALAILLAGYALLGRGLAHVGAPPLYLGEVVLFLAIIAIVANLDRVRLEPTIAILVAFMAWGAFRTIPYIGTYGIDALRDAAGWGYGIFAIAVWLVVDRRLAERLARAYRSFIPILLVWIPIAAVLSLTLGDSIPAGPGSDIPLVVFKSGDFGVHLAGVAAFVLAGMSWQAGGLARLSEVGLWITWSLAVGLVAALNRGAMAAAGMASVSLIFVHSSGRLIRATFAVLFLGAMIGLANPVVDLGVERKISVDQITANISSIFDDNSDPILADSKDWRARWWETIVDYTVYGPYFWNGKGYGVNLADDDGFQVLDDGSLRAPHNGHLQFLARGGVPGVTLWVALQIAFGLTMVNAIRRAGRLQAAIERGVLVTLLVYWLAALANAAVDVYLEGPQGGILFWSVMGMGLALAGHLRRAERGEPPLDREETAAEVPALPARLSVRSAGAADG